MSSVSDGGPDNDGLSGLLAPIRAWFLSRHPQPTSVQVQAWPVVAAGEHALISAGTGSGKSLAAWLPLIDRLLRHPGPRRTRLLYVSPLRALSRDMAANLVDCLEGLLPLPGRPAVTGLSLGLRTGDTEASERARQRRSPPDILLTTPESLFVMLGSAGGRRMLSAIETVIVDEVHALIDSKRGAHLSLSLERLEALSGGRIQRIGISATARPLRLVASWLVGQGRGCRIVAAGHPRPPEISLEQPAWPAETDAEALPWQALIARLVELAGQPGTMLVFCNSRSLAERLAALLAEHLSADELAVHHGSLGQARREAVEAGLKAGQIRLVITTASLELGIDVGALDRVCQIGSPGGINRLLQRAGRARHRPDSRPRLHLFPLGLSDWLDAIALARATAVGRLDRVEPCRQPRDVLAQHLVALVASGHHHIDDLHRLIRRAWPWRRCSRADLERLIDMLHQGYVPGRETGAGPIFRRGDDAVTLAEGAERRCLINAGCIPDWFDYEVFERHSGKLLGRLDEEFAFESSPGQTIQLGGQHWRILRIQTGRVEVEGVDTPAQQLPFWFGDGPGRSPALSGAVAELMIRAEQGQWPSQALPARALRTSLTMLACLPNRSRIVFERFFDPSGDQHLVVHALFGARINRAWALALRKRFCRGFNFELQAAATDNGLLISLGAVHSFALEEVVRWLNSASLHGLLVQALLDTPIFQTRLRWCAATALAISRRDSRGRVPPQIQRSQVENLIARIFPDQLACLENLSGERRVPDHPLVNQALDDCLQGFLDAAGLLRCYRAIEAGRIQVHCVDHADPSPLAEALIRAPRHSYLDPAAAEERRTRNFEPRPMAADPHPQRAARPTEFEQQLLLAGYLPASSAERSGVAARFQALLRRGEAVSVRPGPGRCYWAHVERLSELLAIWPEARVSPFISQGLRPERKLASEEALSRLVLGRIRHTGGLRPRDLVDETGLEPATVRHALESLRQEGLLQAVGGDEDSVWRERRKPLEVTARSGF